MKRARKSGIKIIAITAIIIQGQLSYTLNNLADWPIF